VLVGGYELTGDSNKITIEDMRDTYDVTAFGDAAHKFIPGKRAISLTHAGYLNADAARSHPVLKGIDVDGAVSVVVGQNADPAAGDPMYSVAVRQGQYQSLIEVGKYVPFAAAFANRGDLGGWGVALAALVSFTDSASGSAIDNGAETTNGGAAFLHVLEAAASDTYTIVVEGSASGSFSGEETTLATFTLDASALGSERAAIGGTIPRYTRWEATRSGSAGDTVKIAISLVRF
jgi:hypothetical protein